MLVVCVQVPAKTRERRRDELISLQQRIGEQFAASLVGKEVDVLVVRGWLLLWWASRRVIT